MYNKVKKCLESMGYVFVECLDVELSGGARLTKGFWVAMHDKEVYIETYGSGEIAIWNFRDEDLLYYIPKKEFYEMMFQLGSVLNN